MRCPYLGPYLGPYLIDLLAKGVQVLDAMRCDVLVGAYQAA